MYVKNNGEIKKVKILSVKDFEGYDYNKPGEKWELVEFSDGSKGWIGNIHLFKSLKEAKAHV